MLKGDAKSYLLTTANMLKVANILEVVYLLLQTHWELPTNVCNYTESYPPNTVNKIRVVYLHIFRYTGSHLHEIYMPSINIY